MCVCSFVFHEIYFYHFFLRWQTALLRIPPSLTLAFRNSAKFMWASKKVKSLPPWAMVLHFWFLTIQSSYFIQLPFLSCLTWTSYLKLSHDNGPCLGAGTPVFLPKIQCMFLFFFLTLLFISKICFIVLFISDENSFRTIKNSYRILIACKSFLGLPKLHCYFSKWQENLNKYF